MDNISLGSYKSVASGKSTKSESFHSLSADEMLQRVTKFAKKRIEKSHIFTREAEQGIPRFDIKELQLGKVLGRGGFCVVNEILSVDLRQENNAVLFAGYDDDTVQRSEIRRLRLEKTALHPETKQSRFCLKQLSNDLKKKTTDKTKYIQGVIDLAREVEFLSVFNHPNIIKLRGMCWKDHWTPSFFLILDRLHFTLDNRVAIWRKKVQQSSIRKKLLIFKEKKVMNKIDLERALCAYDLASALRYIHSMHVIYRDLKPENIGFDVNNDVKIFDFGLAREILQEDEVSESPGNYRLTGLSGSLRYMAPEVYRREPYNYSADVYSYSMIYWQILALEKPFSTYTGPSMIIDNVFNKGYRPRVFDFFRKSSVSLIRNGWSENASIRPSLDQVCDVLSEEIAELRESEGGVMRSSLDRSSCSSELDESWKKIEKK